MNYKDIYRKIAAQVYNENPGLEVEIRAGVPDAHNDYALKTAEEHVLAYMALNDIKPRSMADYRKIQIVFSRVGNSQVITQYASQLAHAYDINVPLHLTSG